MRNLWHHPTVTTPCQLAANPARRSFNSPTQDIASQSVTPSCSSTFAGPRRWHCLPLCHRLGRKLRGSSVLDHLVPIPSPACRSSQQVPQIQRTEATAAAVGGGRSSRPRWKNSRTAAHWATEQAKKTMQPQTEEQRGKELTARGLISKATAGLVGGAAAGSAECREHWPRYASLERGAAQATQAA